MYKTSLLCFSFIIAQGFLSPVHACHWGADSDSSDSESSVRAPRPWEINSHSSDSESSVRAPRPWEINSDRELEDLKRQFKQARALRDKKIVQRHKEIQEKHLESLMRQFGKNPFQEEKRKRKEVRELEFLKRQAEKSKKPIRDQDLVDLGVATQDLIRENGNFRDRRVCIARYIQDYGVSKKFAERVYRKLMMETEIGSS